MTQPLGPPEPQSSDSPVTVNQVGEGNSAHHIVGQMNVGGDAHFYGIRVGAFITALFNKLNTKVCLTAIALALGSSGLVWRASPQIAAVFTVRGLAVYQNETLPLIERRRRAINIYKLGLIFNPNSPEIHFNLGLVYEDWKEWDQAVKAYNTAKQAGSIEAYNNLARLYIKQKNYDEAVGFLQDALNSTAYPTFEKPDEYNFHKNLGWARLGQARYQDAEKELKRALEIVAPLEAIKDPTIVQRIIPNRASAHCLLAQVLEKQAKPAEARSYWQKCRDFGDFNIPGSSKIPEEDEWVYIARQRLEP